MPSLAQSAPKCALLVQSALPSALPFSFSSWNTDICTKFHSNPCKDVGGVEKTNFDGTEGRTKQTLNAPLTFYDRGIKSKNNLWTPSPTHQTSTLDPISDKSQGASRPCPSYLCLRRKLVLNSIGTKYVEECCKEQSTVKPFNNSGVTEYILFKNNGLYLFTLVLLINNYC